MLFNSLDFAVFLPIVFIFYWFVFNSNLKIQNLWLVVASYFFYGWWDWRFLSLMLLSSLLDFFIGRGLATHSLEKHRKILLSFSLMGNLGLLFFFKYYNFFLDSFVHSFSFFGIPIEASSLTLVLPVGISFYTFQTLSYSIDVYKRKLEPTNDLISFLAFVSFFPQLVAGPIERASHLLPQFFKKRNFDYNLAINGVRQVAWGLFKKIVIADGCAEYVNTIFGNHTAYSGSTLVVGCVFFAFQIYCDFSGYSDIAIGISRFFGFDIMRNFAFPYFSRDIAEFWRRWHISLSTWFRDYVYFPLGGSNVGRGRQIRNTIIVFLVSGFWHGANWTFIVWGALNALYFIPLLLLRKNRTHLDVVASGKYLPSIKDAVKMLLTFGLITFAWIFFRAESISQAFSYISGIFSSSLFTLPSILPKTLLTLLFTFVGVEWYGREHQFAIEKIGLSWSTPAKFAALYVLIMIIYLFGNFGTNLEFIYFQF